MNVHARAPFASGMNSRMLALATWRYLVILFLASIATSSGAYKPNEISVISFGAKPDSGLDATPAFKKAIEAATKLKDSLVKNTKYFKWTLSSASLQPAVGSKWIWMVHFDAVYQGPSSGIAPYLEIVVHMNGVAVQPQVRDYK